MWNISRLHIAANAIFIEYIIMILFVRSSMILSGTKMNSILQFRKLKWIRFCDDGVYKIDSTISEGNIYWTIPVKNSSHVSEKLFECFICHFSSGNLESTLFLRY